MEAIENREELLKEEERLSDLFNEEHESEEKEEEKYEAPTYDTTLVLKTLQTQAVQLLM